MTKQPKYEIIRTSPIFCGITDGIIGSQSFATGRTFFNAKLAHKIAGRLHDEDYRNCGDDSFHVHYIGSKLRHLGAWPSEGGSDCPF